MTMSLGAGALVRPLALADPGNIRTPAIIMLASLGVVIAIIALPTRALERAAGVAALCAYVGFLALVGFG